jgi:carbon monoxide dehydrogenase subunit G
MANFTLQSEQLSTKANVQELFDFLSDFRNFIEVLPADKVTDFKNSENECSFNIKGITPMTVKLEEKKPFEHILFTSDGLGKFNFRLKAIFFGEPDQSGHCRVDLSGDLNPFIKSMAEKPLSDLINTMALKLSQLQLPNEN